MKTAILLLITMGIQSYSFANSLETTCRTSDNKIVFSDENFAATTENKDLKSVNLLILFTNKKTNKVWEFVDTYTRKDVWATFTATSIGHWKKIAEGGGEECEGGNQGGFETQTRHVSGTLRLGGQDSQINLVCTQTLGYHGDCGN
jgi:nanoRNase/pAp phosphatase (c-di-AMP/oligoRNAs hydrolase)